MRLFRVLPVLALCAVAACSGSNSPTTPSTPTPAPTPTPAAPTVTAITIGGACQTNTPCAAPGPTQLSATATLSNGTQQTITSTANWSSSDGNIATVNATGLVTVHNQGQANIVATYQGRAEGTTVVVPAPWTTNGIGDNVIQLPPYVSRMRIDATYSGSCQNFVVRPVGGVSLVNVIIGTCSVADTRSPFTGTYPVTGGAMIQITISTGVNWRFTEIRP